MLGKIAMNQVSFRRYILNFEKMLKSHTRYATLKNIGGFVFLCTEEGSTREETLGDWK